MRVGSTFDTGFVWGADVVVRVRVCARGIVGRVPHEPYANQGLQGGGSYIGDLAGNIDRVCVLSISVTLG